MVRLFAWTFPGGYKKIQKDTAVAGNTATTLTVPTGKLWLLLAIKIALTTDATVVDRYPLMTQQDVDDDVKVNIAASKVTASLTQNRYWIHALTLVSSTINAIGYGLLSGGEDLVLSITSGQAGDAYDYLVEYLEIDEP